ncbi:MAG: PRD domain-containing protein, partial [Traorella sp.]
NNDKLFVEMKDKFPLTYQCTLDIRDYFENKGSEISDEELLYLMIHINRMIDRGDCYR